MVRTKKLAHEAIGECVTNVLTREIGFGFGKIRVQKSFRPHDSSGLKDGRSKRRNKAAFSNFFGVAVD